MAKNPYKIKDQASQNFKANFPDNQEANLGTIKRQSILKNKIFWPFLILIVGIVFVGIWYIKSQVLEKSLALDIPDYVQEQILLGNEDSAKTIEELKNSDIDQDGLTDYQEIYQYRTSMFLVDTDSDGYTDSEEVTTGNDPLCPAGQNCNLLHLITPQTEIAKIVEEVALDPNMTIQEAALLEFRQFLVENGMTQEEVDSLNDDNLLFIFEIMNDSELGQAYENSEVTAEKVRDFLLAQPGVDVDDVNALSEEELLEIRDSLIPIEL